jgi:hypothetical protein
MMAQTKPSIQKLAKPAKPKKPAIKSNAKSAPPQKAAPVPKPKPPAKPAASKGASPSAPITSSTSANPVMTPEIEAAFKQAENLFFGLLSGTPFTTVTLTSKYGFFKLFEYNNPYAITDRHLVIFFYNKQSKTLYNVHGRIARLYLDQLKSHTDITDFPIDWEAPAKDSPKDRISRLSESARIWNHKTNDVQTVYYKKYTPVEESAVIAYTQEYKWAVPNISFKNWKSYKMDKYEKARGIRYVGMPTQIMLHETAGQGNLVINQISDLFHFCINNADDAGNGHIIQVVDIAERVDHIKGFPKDGSVGIELVNLPFNSKDVKIDLKKSTKGVYIKTSFTSYPELFIPLEFRETAESDTYTLQIDKQDLLNFDALAALEVGKSKTKILTESGGSVTLSNCKSVKYESLIALMKYMHDYKLVHKLNIYDKKQYSYAVVRDQKTYILFQTAHKEEKGNIHHYAIDVRLPGIYVHGVTRSNHSDGYLNGLYVYLRFISKLSPAKAMQRMIDLIAGSKTAAVSRKSFEMAEVLTSKNDGDPANALEVPKKPIKFKIVNYVEV